MRAMLSQAGPYWRRSAAVRVHLGPERPLPVPLPVQQLLVQQPGLVAVDRLLRVLQVEDRVLGGPRPLRAQRGQVLVDADLGVQLGEEGGVLDVAQVLELGDRQQAAGVARVADHEREVAFLRAVRAPAVVLIDVRRLAVLVDAEERHVHVVPRIREVVGVAAEAGRVGLRHEHQAGLGPAVEPVQLVLAAVVHGDHFAVRARRALLAAVLEVTRRRNRGSRPRRTAVAPRRHRAVHAGRDVADLDQLVHAEVRADALVGAGRRVEAVGEEVLAGLRHGVGAAAGAVMVRHDQPVGRHERGRAARNADRRQAGVVEPALRRVEVVTLGPVVEGRRVERPHLAGLEAGVLGRGRGLLRAAGGRDEESERQGGQRAACSESHEVASRVCLRSSDESRMNQSPWTPRARGAVGNAWRQSRRGPSGMRRPAASGGGPARAALMDPRRRR